MKRWRLIEFAELDSTNRHASTHLAELRHADVIQATVQTAGRGRMKRDWVSHLPGNLCLSLVVKPDVGPPDQLPLSNLSQLLALCTCRVLESDAVVPKLKWPNDVLLNGRKIAGILAETVTQGSQFLGLVLGIGVNLNLDAETLASINRPATALNLELNHAIKVDSFRDALLTDFFCEYDSFIESGFSMIRNEFIRCCGFLGERIQVHTAKGTVLEGTAMDVDQSGALVLKDALGRTQVVDIGEMFNWNA